MVIYDYSNRNFKRNILDIVRSKAQVDLWHCLMELSFMRSSILDTIISSWQVKGQIKQIFSMDIQVKLSRYILLLSLHN